MILCASSVKENSLCTINQMVCKKIFLKIFLKILSNDKYRRMESEEHTMERDRTILTQTGTGNKSGAALSG